MRFVFLLLLGACTLTKEQAAKIQGELWQLDKLPPHICNVANIKQYGVYRVQKCPNKTIVGCEGGQKEYEEFISYCANRIDRMSAADDVRIAEWLRAATK
jgi:hypothetical protein